MQVLITGANGFMAKNMIEKLQQHGITAIDKVTRQTSREELQLFTRRCEVVFHFAGVNRSDDATQFEKTNVQFTQTLLAMLQAAGNTATIIATSSIQSELANDYGRSKRQMEQLLFEHHERTGASVYVYRLPNIFGKWSVPNTNSVIATFCYNIARELPIDVHDPDRILQLCHIDDVVEDFLRVSIEKPTINGHFSSVSTIYSVSVGRLAELIQSFHASRSNLTVMDVSEPFIKKLYSTYISFLPEDAFSYSLKTHVDSRGSFTEFLKTVHHGQLSINVSKPGVTKGNHWHHSKHEKFLVVSGEAVVKFRPLYEKRIIEYYVSGEQLQVIDIPPGYAHAIKNIGTTDLVTVMWANECFEVQNPDTYMLEV